MFKRFGPPALLLLGLLVATQELTVGGRIVARGDLLLYFYPLRDFAAEALRAGRLPLWNPYTFMGAPFLANSQAGVFYPVNIVLSWLPVATATSFNIALHLMLAALGMFALTRRALGLTRTAALCAGCAFGLGGYLGAQIEHLNQVQVLAWLPLGACCVLRASPRAAWALAGVLALQISAGHTQSLYLCGVALGLLALAQSLSVALETPAAPAARLRAAVRALPAPMLVLIAGVCGAALLSAAQLLPTIELSRESFRAGGLPFNEASSFSWRPWVIGRALLPTYGDPLFAEYSAYLGASGIALATLGIVQSSSAQARRARVIGIGLCVTGFVLALGMVTPLFALLYRVAPGFNLFRAQARWLIVFAFGASILIGLGAQALREGVTQHASRAWLLLCAGATAGMAGAIWLGARISPEVEYQSLPAQPVLLGWGIAAALSLLCVIGANLTRTRIVAAWLLLALFAIELSLAAQFQPYARSTDPQALSSLRPATAHLLTEFERPNDGRILALSGLFFDPGDKPEQELIFAQSLHPDELYDRLIASKHKEILSPNLSLYYRLPSVDGYDGGLLPTRRFADFARQFVDSSSIAERASIDGRLREFLKTPPDARWLSAMGVRYVIADKTQDVFIDGIFYDQLFSSVLTETREFSLQPYESTAMGLILATPNGAPADRTLAILQLTFADGSTQRFEIVPLQGSPADGFQTVVRWDGPRTPLSARVTPAEVTATLTLRGMTLIDTRDNTFAAQVASSDALVRMVYSGDVKIYEIANYGARASLRNAPALALTIEQTTPESLHIMLPGPLRAADTLLLRDSCYPGWIAHVDGVETPIRCAETLFREIDLPAGARSIRFDYTPASVRIGIGVSAAALVLWLVAGVVLTFGMRRSSAPGWRSSTSTPP